MRRLGSIRNPLRRNSQASHPPSPSSLPGRGRRGRQRNGPGGFDPMAPPRSPSPPPQYRDPQQSTRAFDDDDPDQSDSPPPIGRRPGPRQGLGAPDDDFMQSRSPSPPQGNRRPQRDRDTSNSDNGGNNDDDDAEMLRQAMQESLQFHEGHQWDISEQQRRQQEAEAAVLRESEVDAVRRRRRDEERDEQQRETERQVLEESRRAEEERAQRRRDQLRRMDMEFGSGSGGRRGSGSGSGVREERREQGRRESQRAANSSNANVSAPPASASRRGTEGSPPEETPGRPQRQQSRREPAATHREQQPSERETPPAARGQHPRGQQRQPQYQPETYPGPGPGPGRGAFRGPPPPAFAPARRMSGSSGPRTPYQGPNLMRGGMSSPPMAHPSMGMDPTRGPSRRFGPPPGQPPGAYFVHPADYSLNDVLAQSRNESYSTAPFSEEGEESNHDELQAAISESAEQERDEEAEAIQRNRGVPTYQEACAAPRLRAPRGAKYTFQGPSSVVSEDEEGGGGDGEGRKLEIVGDMDLNEAMRVANSASTGGGRR